MSAFGKRFDYLFSTIQDLAVRTEEDARSGRRKVTDVLVNDEPIKPTERFWTALFARFGINSTFFRYFACPEVFQRISQVESNDRLRLCVERDIQSGDSRLLAVSNPAKPVVLHDDLMSTLTRYGSEKVRYADGIVESTHIPRAGSNSFDIGGDAFSNRFVLCTPVDGYGLPNIYLSLLRHICTNGAVGYAKTFRSSLALGRENDDVNFSIARALEGFGNEEGYAALRQRFDAATKSWASVHEAQSLYKQLLRLHHLKQVGWDGAATAGESGIAKLMHNPDEPVSQPAATDRQDTHSPILTAFNRLTGNVSELYGLANPEALSVKRQRTLPVRCSTYDLINFASETASHHADEYGARATQAWIGNLISGEYDLENSRDSFGDFQDFFLDRKLNGETALELQRIST